ncbi:hypothetical protein PM082_024529 [Marasmius tenuissimus]|nr:hypothetical protein PM082_024529 [Marasmius tenuissimus]
MTISPPFAVSRPYALTSVHDGGPVEFCLVPPVDFLGLGRMQSEPSEHFDGKSTYQEDLLLLLSNSLDATPK